MAFGGVVKLEGESEYRKALSQIKSELKLVSSEMAKVSAEFDKNDTSIEGLTAKNNVLNKQIDEQKNKVNVLTDALAQSQNQFGENSDVTKKWQTELNSAEAELIKLTKEVQSNEEKMRNSQTSIDGASSSVREFANDADSTSKSVFSLGDMIKANLISEAIIGGVKSLGSALKNSIGSVTGLISEMKEYNTDLSKLEQNAISSGNSVEGMKDNMYDLVAMTGETDSSIEALSNLMAAGFEGDGMQSALDGLSGAIVKFPDTLKIESLSDSLQETLATGAATGQFGELIERMGGNLDEFNAGLANCTSEAERQQYALNWLSQSGLAELNEEYHKNNQATIDLSVADQKLTDSKGKLATALTNTVGPALATAKNGLADLGNALASSLSMFASGDVEGGTQLISNALTSLVSDISAMLPQMLTLGTNLIQGLLGGIQEALPELLPVVVETITTLAEFIVENLPLIIEVGIEILLALIQGISESLPTLIPTIIDSLLTIVDTLLNNIDMIVDAGIQLTLGLLNGLMNALPQLIDRLPEIIDKIVMALTNNLPKIIEMGITLVLQLAVGLIQAIPQLVSKVPQIITSLVNGFKNLLSNFLDIGKNIVEGIWNGISNGFDWIKKKIKEWVGNVIDFFKELLGIHSPSRVFSDTIGSNMALGIGEGFSKEMVSVRDSMAKAIPTNFDLGVNTSVNRNLFSSFVPNVDNGVMRNVTATDSVISSNSDNYSIVINNNSKYTSPSENARLMKRSLQIMKLKANKG
ncbi:MAG TPA: hypothetical protein IAB59_07025 [Candidatus Onthousia faecipullorum]|uniref:Phage tail protein n=1 Tax=Candidatus Onthousia faecipullorum TaxID=2840887 RepID=A0A9D1GC64_9FIRM|nr:hypothetical protein [Candidatus Onthousia faecipullorum]